MLGLRVPLSAEAAHYRQMPGEILNDEEGIANMRNLGENIAYLLKALDNQKRLEGAK